MKPFKKSIKAGMHLFRENDRSRELYIIQSGVVKVYRTTGGKEVELAQLQKGAVIGEMALIDGKPRCASAKATDTCEVIIIDAETFHEKIKGVPAWFISIIRMTSQKIRQANHRLQSISNEHLSAKIILALHHYFQRFDHSNNGLSIKQTKHHLIELLGITYQNVLTTFDFLHTHHFIEIKENAIFCKANAIMQDYCDYLRLLIRNQLANLGQISPELQKLSGTVIARYPGILSNENASTPVNGSLFFHLLQTNEIGEEYLSVLYQLESAGICTAVRKPSCKAKLPLADVTITLQHSGWKRLYLFCKFRHLNPGIKSCCS